MPTRNVGLTSDAAAVPSSGGAGSNLQATKSDPIADTIRSLVSLVLDAYPDVELAVLFGSASRGGTRARDVDIGLWTSREDSSALGLIDAALGRALKRSVDVVHLNTAPPLLRFEVARDGSVLVERQPGGWSDFRARAMIDWWDWAPTARRFWASAARRLRTGQDTGTEALSTAPRTVPAQEPADGAP
jgi:predicted nucleotidyltransferase